MQSTKTDFGTITKIRWIVRILSFAVVIGFVIAGFLDEPLHFYGWFFGRNIGYWSGMIVLIPVMIAWRFPLFGGVTLLLFSSLILTITLLRINTIYPRLPFVTPLNLLTIALLFCGLLFLVIEYLKRKAGML